MSVDYRASFSLCQLPFDQLLARLEGVCERNGLRFSGEAVQLHSQNGTPNVMSIETHPAEDLKQLAIVAKRWFGTAFMCVSESLAEALGRTDAIEVYFNVFRGPGGAHAIEYTEGRGAMQARLQSEELARNLYGLLLDGCQSLDLDAVIYAEELDDSLFPARGEVESLLLKCAANGPPPEICAAFSTKLIDFETARAFAGPDGRNLRLALGGYVLLPLPLGS